MKRSFIISTIFFLCAFFLISTAAEAITAINPLTVDYVHRLVVAEGWPEEYPGYGDGNEHESSELGNFKFSAYGVVVIEEEWEGGYFCWEEQVTEAYQNSNITIEDNKLVLEGTGYSDNYYWDHDDPYYDGYAESSIELNFTIDQNYLLSLSGTLYGYYSSNWGTSSSYFHLYDKDDDTWIIYAAGSDSGTSLDESLLLPSGAYSLTIKAYDGRFENINLTLEPAASVPIPQSFWLLCSGSILILLYARRQVMA